MKKEKKNSLKTYHIVLCLTYLVAITMHLIEFNYFEQMNRWYDPITRFFISNALFPTTILTLGGLIMLLTRAISKRRLRTFALWLISTVKYGAALAWTVLIYCFVNYYGRPIYAYILVAAYILLLVIGYFVEWYCIVKRKDKKKAEN